jgi:Domain of unknown function (DUF3850)
MSKCYAGKGVQYPEHIGVPNSRFCQCGKIEVHCFHFPASRQSHELKTWPVPFNMIWEGLKTFEVRLNDRGFLVYDELVLREYDPETSTYSGRVVRATAGCVLFGWGLDPRYVMMSLLDVKRVVE